VTGLWGGQTGSLVFWVLLLTLLRALASCRTADEPGVHALRGGHAPRGLAFFLMVILFTSNPFDTMSFTPADGRGMNPQLQNYWMTIHPPTLYLGFTAFTIPFAFASPRCSPAGSTPAGSPPRALDASPRGSS
jgi:cytochrome c-type biogenesis protein CcmF